MSRRATCCICGNLFWNTCSLNANRQNLTCEKELCRRTRKTQRQRERRFAKRQARLEVRAVRRALGKRLRKRRALRKK